MANPWASGAWAVGALASGSWLVSPSHAGVSWGTTTWAGNTWAVGSWQEAWASAGNFTITAPPISFFRTYILSAQTGSYTYVGTNTAFNLTAKTGAYSLAGSATLTANSYRINLVNTHNEVVDNSVSIQIAGTNLTGTTSVKLQYAKGNALNPGSWATGTNPAWATGAWADGTLGVVETNLTNVSVVNSNLITADMVDVETSPVPFTDENHPSHRIYISDGVRSFFSYIEVLPSQFYTIGSVQPIDANTTVGQSIFGGMTINANMQVMLPTIVGPANAQWETSNGNVTGRLTLSTSLPSTQSLSIPIWDDAVGWDVINVDIKDISNINTTMSVQAGTFGLAGQDVSWRRTYNLSCTTGAVTLSGQTVSIVKGFVVQPTSLFINPTLSPPLLADGLTITSVNGLGPDVIQSGSRFTVQGVGFGDINTTTVTLVDFLNEIPCTIVQINNSFIEAIAPTNSGALSDPTLLTINNGQKTVLRQVSVKVFNTNSLRSATSLTNSTLIQANILPVNGANLLTSISNSTLSGGVTSLSVNGLNSTTTFISPAITQHNIIASNSTTSATTIGNVSLSQKYGLFTASLVLGTTLQQPSLTYYSLLVNNLNCSSTLGNSTLVQHNIEAVNNSSCTTRLSNVDLVQKNILSNNGLTSASTLNNVSITYKPLLNVGNLSLGTTISNSSITGKYVLSVNGMTFATQLYDSNVSKIFNIASNDITIASLLNNTSLSQDTPLSISGLSIDTRLSKPSVIPRYTIDVDGLVSKTSLSSSRAKICPDPIFINKINSYPIIIGQITNR